MSLILWILSGWFLLGLFGWSCTEDFDVFLYLSPTAVVYWPMQWRRALRENRERAEYARINQLNRDYLEVLQMIEWKYREPTPLELLQEELELERVYE